MSHIYLMKPRGIDGVYKIGETIDLERRMKRKQKQVDFEIEYKVFVEIDPRFRVSIETQIHFRLSRYRLGADWFVLNDALVDAFPAYAKYLEKWEIDHAKDICFEESI